MLGLPEAVTSRIHVPALFRRTAQDIQFTPEIFDSKQTPSGTLVRLTYDMVLELEQRRPGFIAKLVDYEVVAPYPTNGHLHDELKRRFGHTNPDRIVFAIMDDKNAPPGHTPEPLSIIYGAFGDKLADSLDEITSGRLGRKKGASPSAITFYSAINMAHKDTDERRVKLSAGIGGRQVEEARKWLKEKCPSLTTAATLSPLIGFEKWLQETVDDAEVAALTKTLTQTRRGITLDELREARRIGGSALLHPKVMAATARAIAVFVMRTKPGRDGKPVPQDLAFRLHAGNGGKVAAALLADPTDPRMRYYYPMNDDLLTANATRFKETGMPTVLTGFRNIMDDEAVKRVYEATHPEGRRSWLANGILSPTQAVVRRLYLGL